MQWEEYVNILNLSILSISTGQHLVKSKMFYLKAKQYLISWF